MGCDRSPLLVLSCNFFFCAGCAKTQLWNTRVASVWAQICRVHSGQPIRHLICYFVRYKFSLIGKLQAVKPGDSH
ncbi:hypothetical protein ECG_03949 [Echinococcus granulosus]|nr:hypothetical protein ECG_03949 [Echinococcus granulosus]